MEVDYCFFIHETVGLHFVPQNVRSHNCAVGTIENTLAQCLHKCCIKSNI